MVGRKLIRGRRCMRHAVNVVLWLLFVVFAFGYVLGGFLAGWLKDMGKIKEAIAVYRLALKIFPWGAANHNDLGLTLLSYGDVEGAIVELRKAVDAAPHVSKYHNHLGLALLKNGDIDDSIQEFREAIRLDLQYDEPRKNLDRAISAKGKKVVRKRAISSRGWDQKRAFYFSGGWRGRPRGRRLASSPRRRAVCAAHASLPKGVPRFTLCRSGNRLPLGPWAVFG